MKRLLFVLMAIGMSTSPALAVNPLFRYGFLGGTFSPTEDARVSSWNDIHYACHFSDSVRLQNLITQIAQRGNKVLVELSSMFQNHTPTCGLNGPWGDFPLFSSRIRPLVSTLNANKISLSAIILFDEPDTAHGGPSPATLQAAVDYLHVHVPGVPVFVNWFTASNNVRVPNADWYSTTKGAKPSSLSGFGKPMFLWWFNNEASPSADTISNRWTGILNYYYRTLSPSVPPIMALGWCCDSIENFNGPWNDNSTELDALLMHLGSLRHAGSGITRPGHIHLSDDWWLFRVNAGTGQCEYTKKGLFPTYRPFPIGTPSGSSSNWPMVTLEGNNIRIVVRANDSNFYETFVTTSGSWTKWIRLNSGPVSRDLFFNGVTCTARTAQAERLCGRPDLFRFNGVTWLGVRGVDNAIWVQRRGVDSWTSLGGVATSPPLFKIVNGNLRIAVFWTNNKVYSRQWNGVSWSNWAIEF
jgi:hypothetical protein